MRFFARHVADCFHKRMILVGGLGNHQVFPENSVNRALEIGVEIIAAGA
jgi:hypothetical protein